MLFIFYEPVNNYYGRFDKIIRNIYLIRVGEFTIDQNLFSGVNLALWTELSFVLERNENYRISVAILMYLGLYL